jgi:hypothetical protein
MSIEHVVTNQRVLMNTTYLLHLSHGIKNGRPLWSLICANEQLERNHPMRKAFAQEALRVVNRFLLEEERIIVEEIKAGAKLAELPEGSAALIRALDQRTVQKPRREVPLCGQNRARYGFRSDSSRSRSSSLRSETIRSYAWLSSMNS